MPPRASKKGYDHCGGLEADQVGYRPLESELHEWLASLHLSNAQVQALLVVELSSLYGTTSKRNLKLKKDLHGNSVKKHNQPLTSGHAEWITVMVANVSPLQLLVQHRFHQATVCC